MTLAQIASFVNRALRFKMHPDQVILIMDSAQRMAFDYNSQSFLSWSNTLAPQFYLYFVSAGYVNAISGDVGKAVVGASSGATGTLVSYDNTARSWLISTTSNFTNGEAITITTGTGAGTLLSSNSQIGYVGPYSAPTSPPVRKIWGVTAETDGRIFGTEFPVIYPMNDFDFLPRLFDPSHFFKPGREDNLAKTFTFAQAPVLALTYRWVYWRDAKTIDGTSDNTELQIPATYHLNFVNACVKLGQILLSGEDVDPRVIQAFFQPWYNTLARPYTPMGKATNQTVNSRSLWGSFL
jgi:hypothetical protein